ncbi:hypothetical protein PCH_Pc21g22580 [Penicillium rubens Wisconsin 54-1255]|uniref:Uncharacterized protein n=1 Tax=Penicillium rubens (strain ATCC 28089 / DSM 1075 / NRRL 1951 / Wisconsin 54-1255) TaxID=500485 RepID=B6HNG6_PENRW|nr:hypothetical protein PCH_Pc21g22580 [Penicillium rubens Wisconsin 54-1255]
MHHVHMHHVHMHHMSDNLGTQIHNMTSMDAWPTYHAHRPSHDCEATQPHNIISLQYNSIISCCLSRHAIPMKKKNKKKNPSNDINEQSSTPPSTPPSIQVHHPSQPTIQVNNPHQSSSQFDPHIR